MGHISYSLQGRELDLFLLVDLHGDIYPIGHQIVILRQSLLQLHLLLVYLWILHQIFLQVHLQIHYQTHHQFSLQDVMHQRSPPLSTLYPLKTSESSPNSSSERSLESSLPSVGPSRKTC
nr:hypothetical protein [Tanacetum cinerariifolium]